MSGSPRDDDELERLREERLQELQDQQSQEELRDAQREAVENQKRAMLQQYLTDGARKRLNTVKMGRPDHGEQVEQQLLALIQSGRVQSKIDEDTMKQLLRELQPDRKKFDIRRR
ncbi:MAG: DNA-binding protein [Halobacteriota archaeon]